MKQLTEMEPDTEFYFIIGGDMIDMLPEWHRIDELVTACQISSVLVDLEQLEKRHYPVTMVDIPQIDLSSTLIRQRFSEERYGPVSYPACSGSIYP